MLYMGGNKTNTAKARGSDQTKPEVADDCCVCTAVAEFGHAAGLPPMWSTLTTSVGMTSTVISKEAWPPMLEILPLFWKLWSLILCILHELIDLLLHCPRMPNWAMPLVLASMLAVRAPFKATLYPTLTGTVGVMTNGTGPTMNLIEENLSLAICQDLPIFLAYL